MAQIDIDPADLAELRRHLASYDEWDEERSALSEAENEGDYPNSSSWHDNDDQAVEILHNVVSLIKTALEPA